MVQDDVYLRSDHISEEEKGRNNNKNNTIDQVFSQTRFVIIIAWCLLLQLIISAQDMLNKFIILKAQKGLKLHGTRWCLIKVRPYFRRRKFQGRNNNKNNTSDRVFSQTRFVIIIAWCLLFQLIISAQDIAPQLAYRNELKVSFLP